MKELIVNADVYSYPVIEAAIVAYKDLARISVCQKDRRIRLVFDKCRFDSLITMREFENYLIGLENS